MGTWLDWLIGASIRQRRIVVMIALVASIAAVAGLRSVPLDVLPDVSPPRVVVHTEAPGLGTRDVEALVTTPIEQVLLGTPQAVTVRSTSASGLSLVTIVFADDTDIFRARQVVAERLQGARASVETVAGTPTIAPISAAMGALLKHCIALPQGAESSALEEVRTYLQWRLRPQLLALGGVANVTVHGGGIERIEVRPDAGRAAAMGVRPLALLDAIQRAHAFESAVLDDGVRRGEIVAQMRIGIDDAVDRLGALPVETTAGARLQLVDVAEVVRAHGPAAGAAWCAGGPGIYLQIDKLPWADTLATTTAVEEVLTAARLELPSGAILETAAFRQADFVNTSLRAVGRAMALGAAFVVIVLVALLGSSRLAMISVVAIPLSIGAAAWVLVILGHTINGMTLGGLAIAVGEVVDDAIIDVENVWRRLRENQAASDPRPTVEVIRGASLEIRGSVVHASVIVCVVLLPVLLLGGLAGRIFAPLAAAYMLAIAASLAVALTVTPALCAFVLPRLATAEGPQHGLLARGMLRGYRVALAAATRHGGIVLLGSLAAAAAAIAVLPTLGGRFLPELREGTLIARVQTTPGTSLDEATRLLGRIERASTSDAIAGIAGRAGRAPLDDDSSPAHGMEIDFVLDPNRVGEPEDAVPEVAGGIARIPGLGFVVEGFLTERIHEVLTGETAPIVVELAGDDLAGLRKLASEIAMILHDVPGITAVRPEPMIDVPELHIVPNDLLAQQAGVSPRQLADEVGMWTRGRHALWLREADGRLVEVVLTGGPDLRRPAAAAGLSIVSPVLGPMALADIADLQRHTAPTQIRHDGGRKRLVVSASIGDALLSEVVAEVERRIAGIERPAGVVVKIAGEAAARREAAWELLGIGTAVAAGVFALLSVAFSSSRDAAIVMLVLPFGLVGGVTAAALTPEGVSVAGLVGFVTLFGIIARNGIMFVAHKRHLERQYPSEDPVAVVMRAAEERLLPIVMTAATAGLALIPMAASLELPGSELEAPMAVIVCGGLLSSTALTLVVLPTLYARLAQRRRPSTEARQ